MNNESMNDDVSSRESVRRPVQQYHCTVPLAIVAVAGLWAMMMPESYSSPVYSAEKCRSEFKASVETPDFVALTNAFKQRPDNDVCSSSMLDGMRLEATREVAKRAQQVLQRTGDPDQAMAWFNGKADAKFRLSVDWQVNAVRGLIEKRRKNWREAASQFEAAYEASLGSGDKNRLHSLYLQATEARHLAGNLGDLISRSTGEAGATFSSRGISNEAEAVPVRIQFDTNSAEIKPAGEEAIDLIVNHINYENIQEIKLTGHTDWRGTEKYNQGLSERRARAVAAAIKKKYSQNFGGDLKIRSEGAGENCPRIVGSVEDYDADTLAELYRRVSLVWPRDFNSQLSNCDDGYGVESDNDSRLAQ